MLKTVFLIMPFAAMALFAPAIEAKEINEHIYIVSAGEVDEKVVKAVRDALPGCLPMSANVGIMPAEKVAQAAYNASRDQYDAQAIIDDISQRIGIDITTESLLVMTDVDLYSPELNFVFGSANIPRKICVMSVTRLRNEFYGLRPDARLFYERALKESVHELGHIWGLSHCPDSRCVMYFSDRLSGTDRKRSSFCHSCRRKLENRYISPLIKGTLF
jgi:archaemetzincin